MGRTPFQTSRPPASASGGELASIYRTASANKASWLRELWAVKAMMMANGNNREQNYQLATKVVGWQVSALEELTLNELVAVREFMTAEGGE